MKFTIKAIIISAITTLSAMSAVLYTSCNRDRCKTIICANRGICNKGVCTCPSGYEGTNCETITRQKFTGNWSVFEKGSSSLAKQYQVNVVAGEGINYVNINNFYNFFHSPIKAYVVGGDRIIIPNQQMEGKVIWGEGNIYSNVTYGQYGGITMRYIVQDTLTLVKDDFGYESALDFSDASAWNK
ncbi:hypothetical protein CJD36_020575 [Flavipsychrobacter stenotrophus]|uniref:EGF-like domain-containing protein n=1 Tax=Flavipsychrobacter stenotrophus TaxID=2077091 RepID=A0A2S7SR15_9BACT|nr:calcium-binding EGF-like domain-containing protein [Flavipsychrobacter stenotrophus]PQJ09184.1 hypothetical protein CJD36_020575 [Flavipsychrobacter stenotrophus]